MPARPPSPAGYDYSAAAYGDYSAYYAVAGAAAAGSGAHGAPPPPLPKPPTAVEVPLRAGGGGGAGPAGQGLSEEELMAMLKERMSHLQQAGAEAGPSSKEAQVRSQGRRGPLLSPHVSLAHPPPGQPQPWQCGHACQWACQGPATCIRGKPTPRCSWCRPAQRDCLHCLCWACAPAPSPCLWLPEILLAGCSTSPCGHLSGHLIGRLLV